FNDNGKASNDLLDNQFAHWSFFFNSNASFLQGNQYQDNADGTFKTTAATLRYANLDQYLMGIRSGDTVDPVFFIKDPTKISGVTINGQTVSAKDPLARSLPPLAPPEFGTVTVAGTRRDVSLADIQAVEGQRFPEPSPSTARVKMAFIMIVPAGREPDPVSLGMIKNIKKQFPDSYHNATGGVGIADISLKAEGGSDQKPPVVNIAFPKGGETVDAGSRINISWSASDENGIAKQDIALSTDG